MNRIIRASMLFLLLLAPGGILADDDGKPQVFVEGKSLFYIGRTTRDGFKQAQAEFQKAKNKIEWLCIDSRGGEVDASMDMGLWVFNNGINVKIENKCLGTCANYIFPAGKSKKIEKNAIVAWYLLTVQNDLFTYFKLSYKFSEQYLSLPEGEAREKILLDVEHHFIQLIQKQELFYEEIGVDQNITVVGQKEGLDDKRFWSISIEDMAKFGITDVVAPDNYVQTIKSISDVVVFIEPSD